MLNKYRKLLFRDQKGDLRYVADEQNNYIPDFSYVGYRSGNVPLPEVPVKLSLAPVERDATRYIQAALDSIGRMPVDAEGFRGALLLEAGRYEVSGQLFLRADGVVLRGSGGGNRSVWAGERSRATRSDRHRR